MAAVERVFKNGEYLFKEGDPSQCIYVITRGAVSIRKAKGSAYIEIAKVHANEVIGELSFFDRQSRSASAVALGDVYAQEIDFSSLDATYKAVPKYLQTIMGCVATRLRKANETIRLLQNNIVKSGAAEIPKVDFDNDPEVQELLKASSDFGSPGLGSSSGEGEKK
ncbi:MAG: cyclic nucleotide-binding domain-containing protein [Xanthomonadaceae bacterium]|nr:cyclic nucleotide-binding domain-containing protein [Xanthomonadaceae bacterium]